MLAQADVPFQTADAPLDEQAVKQDLAGRGRSARRVAEELASAKARSVAATPGALVLGADQTLELEDGRMLNKAADRDEAAEQLRMLAGRCHQLHSAAALVQDGAELWRATESVRLFARPLSNAFIQSYLHAEWEAVRWCVGGYRIEGPGVQLFERIEGSHFAVLGLPLLPLLAELRTRGLIPS